MPGNNTLMAWDRYLSPSDQEVHELVENYPRILSFLSVDEQGRARFREGLDGLISRTESRLGDVRSRVLNYHAEYRTILELRFQLFVPNRAGGLIVTLDRPYTRQNESYNPGLQLQTFRSNYDFTDCSIAYECECDDYSDCTYCEWGTGACRTHNDSH